jgi:hypothetical protein
LILQNTAAKIFGATLRGQEPKTVEYSVAAAISD